MDGGWPEIVVNSCLEILEGRIGQKRLGMFGQQVRERENKWVEMISEPGFWQLNKKRVTGRPCLCPEETQEGRRQEMSEGARPKRRQENTERPPTGLRCESNRPRLSASSWEIPMIFRALHSMAPRKGKVWGRSTSQISTHYTWNGIDVRRWCRWVYFNASPVPEI